MPHPNILTTHVLDTARGQPAQGLLITLYRHVRSDSASENSSLDEGTWEEIGRTVTNDDGRGPGWLSPQAIAAMQPGIFKATFFTKEYFDRTGTANFYPQVDIIFRIADVTQHYHIPLNLSPFGYSTYRGS